jgi:hypothetical protein
MQSDVTSESAPIFITGSVRSGTTIVRDALVNGVGIPGYTEGCFVDMLGVFIANADQKFRQRQGEKRQPEEIIISNVPQETFKQDLAVWFRKQYETYTPYRGVWIDKTPDNDVLPAVEYIQFAWPSAKFIFMKRRAIENILSRLRKFPNMTFERQCIAWAKIMQDTLRAKSALNPSSYIEIDQYDIAKHPEQVANRIGIFLNLSMGDIKKMQSVFAHQRPEFTGGNEIDNPSFDDLAWTSEEKAFFMQTCGPLMKTYGWSFDHAYYATPSTP